jgi:PAS domain S-box-containing protein
MSLTPSAHSELLARRGRRERRALLAVLAGVAAGLVWLLWTGRLATVEAERARLAGQAQVVALNLEQRLGGTRAALTALREDLRHRGPALRPGELGTTLHRMCMLMPGVLAIDLFDAEGRVVASDQPQRLADPASPRSEAFQRVRRRPDPLLLFVSPPSGSAPGRSQVQLSLALTDAQGLFQGVVAATLDVVYFDTLLASILYAPDMSGVLLHGEGAVILAQPAGTTVEGLDLALAGGGSSPPLASGRPATAQVDPPRHGSTERLVALRPVQTAELALEPPLFVSMSRPLAAVLAPWRLQAALELGLFAVAGAALALTLSLKQRRGLEALHFEAARRAQQDQETERLALVLSGGELALWDLDVTTGKATVSERWAGMLGHEPAQLQSEEAGWLALLHPEDRDRAAAAQHAYLQGRSDRFDIVYRMRHRDGHWIWIQDRGRIVERDAAGRALRMVGTHMDISGRMLAEETLRRNEQSLAVTLQSIGDAVIATDTGGRVTRINAAAERLVGWSAAEAIGQPLGQMFRIRSASTRTPLPDPVQRVLGSGEVVALANDTVLVARDGSERQIADSAAPIRTASGEVLGVVLVFSDVTEHYRMVQALRHSELKSRSLLAALRSGVVVHGPDTAVLDANPSACRILGLSLEQMQGRQATDPDWRFLEEDHSEMALARYPVNQVLASGQALMNLMAGIRRPDLERPLWVLCNAFPVQAEDGTLAQIVVTFADMTERKLAQEELQRSEAQLRMVSRVARLGGWQLDLLSHRSSMTPEFHAILERNTLEPLAPGAGYDFLLPPDRAALQTQIDACRTLGRPFDIELDALTSAGRPLRLRMLGEAVRDAGGRIVAMQGAIQDITESRQAQQLLRLLEAAVAQLNDVVVISEVTPTGAPGPVVFVNQAFERLTGWQRSEVLGQPQSVFDGEPTGGAEQRRLADALSRQVSARAELQKYRRDGQAYWIEMEVVPLLDAQGRTTHRVSVQRDIGERKRTDAAMLAAREDLAATLDAIPDLLFEIDLEGTILSQHSPRHDLLYVPAENQIGRRVSEILPPPAAAVVMAALQAAHIQGRSSGGQYPLQIAGQLKAFELSVARKPTPDGELPRFITLVRDVTEREKAEADRQTLERQLREAQKMESIGTLAGGIAHDFNNILAAILGNVALAQQDLAPEHPSRAAMVQIQKAGFRARSLVQQILTFSRHQSSPALQQALRPVLEEALALLRATLPASVQVVTALADEPLQVRADATQLHQVIMNLCTNAWHALPEGRGRIEIGLERLIGETSQLPPLAALPPGAWAHVWVSDDGSGMDAATLERVFDPFFTTKPVGQGTGLGLSVVHGILRGHGGIIRVASAPGLGSTFHVLLPLVTETGAATGHGAEPEQVPAPGQGQVVLYVDDDEVMVELVQRLLERQGYRVITATSAAAALAVLRAPAGRCDILVSDYNMPQTSGLELAFEVARAWPGLPMIISSGYVTEELHLQALAAGVRALLKKENTFEELGALVQQLLARPPAGSGHGRQ